MIKNLRFALVFAFMAVCGSIAAQKVVADDPVEVEFKTLYSALAEEGKTVVYLEKNPAQIEDAATITFAKGGAKSAPNYNISKEFIQLFGGSLATAEETEGNTMTYKSEKFIKQINLVSTKATPWAEVKCNVGQLVKNEKNPRNFVWSNKDADGKRIDVNEVVFTVYSSDVTPEGEAQSPSDKDHVRYTKTKVITYSLVDDETGINNITAANAQNGARYNMAGQRVGNDFKGLVVENGQKKIVK